MTDVLGGGEPVVDPWWAVDREPDVFFATNLSADAPFEPAPVTKTRCLGG